MKIEIIARKPTMQKKKMVRKFFMQKEYKSKQKWDLHKENGIKECKIKFFFLFLTNLKYYCLKQK